MNAIFLEKQKFSLLTDAPIPQPAIDEALIKIHLAGICATDLEMIGGYYPFTGILGHEFIGEVVQSPGNSSLIGRRVVGEINISCGQCRFCQANLPTHCEQRSTLGIRNHNGCFAEYAVLPTRNLHLVPDEVPDEAAVFTEPLAAALEIQEQVAIRPNHRVLLIGAGRLGQIIAQTLVLTGCDLRVVVRHPHHQQILAQAGISTLIEEEVHSHQWDIIVEATGSSSGFELARRAIIPRGTIVLKSTFKGNISCNMSSLVVDEINLVGSRCGPFPPALRLMQNKLVNPLPLITQTYPLTEATAALQHAAQSGILKILLNCQAHLQ